MRSTLAALLCLAACGAPLPVFTEGEPCDCRRDLGIVGVTAEGACLECVSDPIVARGSGLTIHSNRCRMNAVAPDRCGP